MSGSEPETLRPWAVEAECPTLACLPGGDSSSHQVAFGPIRMAPSYLLRCLPPNGSQLCDPWERRAFHLPTRHPDGLRVCMRLPTWEPL